jgi:hypothetical protein
MFLPPPRTDASMAALFGQQKAQDAGYNSYADRTKHGLTHRHEKNGTAQSARQINVTSLLYLKPVSAPPDENT